MIDDDDEDAVPSKSGISGLVSPIAVPPLPFFDVNERGIKNNYLYFSL